MVKEFFAGKRKIICLVIACILLIMCALHVSFSSMLFLPKGEFLCSSISPNGEYKINAYISVKSLSDDAIRCELEDLNEGKTKNIYWEYRKSEAKIEWLDNETVCINGRKLNVETDYYDWRQDDTFD